MKNNSFEALMELDIVDLINLENKMQKTLSEKHLEKFHADFQRKVQMTTNIIGLQKSINEVGEKE